MSEINLIKAQIENILLRLNALENPVKKIKVSQGVNPQWRKDAVELLDFLNKQAQRNFKPVESTLKPIIARLKEGYTKRDISLVFSYKCNIDPYFNEHPEYKSYDTLCRKEKFPKYLDEANRYNGGNSGDRAEVIDWDSKEISRSELVGDSTEGDYSRD